MTKCKSTRCEVTSPKKLKRNGYCDKHQHVAPAPKETATASDEKSLLQRMIDVEVENKFLKAENSSMKIALKAALAAIDN